jgi:enoyl-CoA hydratase
MDDGKLETLQIATRGPIAELTLTRPELLNRFDAALHREFPEALLELRRRPELRAIVLASTGKVFSAGGDTEFIRSVHDDTGFRIKVIDEGRLIINTLIDLPIPVVVALQGDAIGLGASVILACDAVVAARTARIGDPHVRMGLVAGDGGCLGWPQSAGMLLAKRFLLTGDPVGAEDAYGMGMVTDLVDGPDDALPAARALAERIAALPPLAVQGTKRALNRVMQQRSGEVLDLSFSQEAQSAASDDVIEAITAFKQRRPGQFNGR